MQKSFRIAFIGGIVLFQSLFVFSQELPIENIEVRSKYNASYLTSYSNVYLYKIEPLERSRILSVIREFESSGLFDRIEWNLMKVEGKESNKLVLRPVYPKDYETYVLQDVVLDYLPGVDSRTFRRLLVEDGIEFGSPWYTNSYSHIVTKIKSALVRSIESDSTLAEVENPWISIRCLQPRQVSLVVRGSSFDHLRITRLENR